MSKPVMLILSLGILLLGACATPQASDEPEAPPAAVEPTEPLAEATEAPAPTAAPIPTETASEAMEPGLPFDLISTAFEQGESIPVQYSCDGEDISPSLAWGDPPDGTQTLVLIMDDPDAPGGTWDHWIVFNIPAELRELPEAMSVGEVAATFGKNSGGRGDYGGPCPPGGTHRYFFKLYAVDTSLSLDENANKGQVLAAMEGHILAETELMGTYSR
jgi:Raf kinase inhibitor-like YbhB/YbcL family protein